jgi:hypothetical protein
VAFDPDGSVVVAGGFKEYATFDGEVVEAASSRADAFIARYTGEGNLHWIRTGGGSANDDLAHGVVSLSDGSVVVSGDFFDWALFGSGEPNSTVLSSDGEYDLFLARLAY